MSFGEVELAPTFGVKINIYNTCLSIRAITVKKYQFVAQNGNTDPQEHLNLFFSLSSFWWQRKFLTVTYNQPTPFSYFLMTSNFNLSFIRF